MKSSYQFLTKANTLQYLYGKLRYSEVLELLLFSVKDFLEDSATVLEKIKRLFEGETIIVRSSAKEEDNENGSLAGHFKSVLDINSLDEEQINKAIQIVISSYKKESYSTTNLLNQQIFIQRQILPCEIDISGVAFSYDPHSQAPYYFVSYDNQGSTNAVTSGEYSKAIYLHKDYNKQCFQWVGLVKGLREIETLLANEQLDIEFAILKNGKIVIFQVRELVTKSICMPVNEYDELVKRTFGAIKDFSDVYSDMSFWNPAEMIGCSPHPLDYSLYDALLMRTAWNEGIVRMGYSQCDDGLMIKVGNHPYISLRNTIRGLLPAKISKRIANSLERYYLTRIKECPDIHDKVEFELIYNCAYVGFEDEIEKNLASFISRKERDILKKELLNLTRNAIQHYNCNFKVDMEKLSLLHDEQEQFQEELNSGDISLYALQQGIFRHLNAIKTHIATQFAYHARNAFISRKLIDSVARVHHLSDKVQNEFIASIPTVVSEFMREMQDELISDDKLNNKYGHIRNSTYDLLSKKYSTIGIDKLRGGPKILESAIAEDFSLLINPIVALLGSDFSQVEAYLKTSMQMRELLKFEYAHAVSILLDAIEKMAIALDITIEDMVYSYIDTLVEVDFSSSVEQARDIIMGQIIDNKHSYESNLGLICPAVISAVNDCYAIKMFNDRPNFVTNNSALAEVIYCPNSLLNEKVNELDLNGKILLVEKAEPGNDWIFSKYRIAGIIAKYGGAASHMAIRCLEQGIPAALGCGEKIFRFVQSCCFVCLDCKKGEISKLS
ncbi:MAG: hypothetical protein K2J01_03125 [Clostridiales bacterium]|nr:hypothetical protein [Clostridiales bacterium]